MMSTLIKRVEAGSDLSRQEAEIAMEEILSGRSNEETIVALLTVLRAKGETVGELVGFARAMRRHATPVFADGSRPDELLVDTCGTGGDAAGTFNISTAAAFVVAGAGVRVAKHGNRSLSSKCGSADVLEVLGLNLALPAERIGEAIEHVGIGFLFAPAVHTAMRHAMAARRKLGGQTIFNLLGPLTNPAGASAQVLGVFAPALTDLLAQAASQLGIARALVVHGTDGLDEISLCADTYVAEVNEGAVRRYTVGPEDFGLARVPSKALAGGDAAENARIIRAIFEGERGPRRDVVLANVSAALVAAGRAADFREGVRMAAESLDSGAARAKLDSLIAFAKT